MQQFSNCYKKINSHAICQGRGGGWMDGGHEGGFMAELGMHTQLEPTVPRSLTDMQTHGFTPCTPMFRHTPGSPLNTMTGASSLGREDVLDADERT